jgi:hypothetical protein
MHDNSDFQMLGHANGHRRWQHEGGIRSPRALTERANLLCPDRFLSFCAPG